MSVHCSYLFYIVISLFHFETTPEIHSLLFFKLEFSSYILSHGFQAAILCTDLSMTTVSLADKREKVHKKFFSVEAPETVLGLLLNAVRLKRQKDIEAIDPYYVPMKFKSTLDAHLK